jgi:hypothetical protein
MTGNTTILVAVIIFSIVLIACVRHNIIHNVGQLKEATFWKEQAK